MTCLWDSLGYGAIGITITNHKFSRTSLIGCLYNESLTLLWKLQFLSFWKTSYVHNYLFYQKHFIWQVSELMKIAVKEKHFNTQNKTLQENSLCSWSTEIFQFNFSIKSTQSVGMSIAVGQIKICKFVTHSDVNQINNSTWGQLISTFWNNAGTVLFT